MPFLPPHLLWLGSLPVLLFTHQPMHFLEVTAERKPLTHTHKRMLVSWGTFLKQWICIWELPPSVCVCVFVFHYFLGIKKTKNKKIILHFYVSPAIKSLRMLSSQSILTLHWYS